MDHPEAKIFYEPGLHVIRLGNLGRLNGKPNLTIDGQPDGPARGFTLSETNFSLLGSLDPDSIDRDFSLDEKAFLLTLALEQGLTFVTDAGGAKQLDFVLISRQTMTAEEEVDEGYLIRLEDGGSFVLTDVGARLLAFADGTRTLSEIVSLTTSALLSEPDTRAIAEATAKNEGRTVDAILFGEALALVKVMADSGAATFEPQVLMTHIPSR